MTFSFHLTMVSKGSGGGIGIVFFELKIWRQRAKTEPKQNLDPLPLRLAFMITGQPGKVH